MKKKRNLSIIAIAVLVAVVVFATQTARKAEVTQVEPELCCSQAQFDSFKLSLETTACFGTCPVYSLLISGQGEMKVIGKRYVNFEIIEKKLSAETMLSIGQLVYQSNYFSTPDRFSYEGKGCSSVVTDSPTSRWRIEIGKDNHAIDYYKGCLGAPEELDLLESELISILGLSEKLN